MVPLHANQHACSQLHQIRKQTISGSASAVARSSRWLARHHYPYYSHPLRPNVPIFRELFEGRLNSLLQFSGSEVEGTLQMPGSLNRTHPRTSLRSLVPVDVREAPISIVNARECDLETTSQCNVDEEYEPLEIIFLDGTESLIRPG